MKIIPLLIVPVGLGGVSLIVCRSRGGGIELVGVWQWRWVLYR